MIFEEKSDFSLYIINDVFVYFLLKDKDVVYVGKTTVGLSRPLKHKNNKDFDEIKIIYCEKDDLDYFEDKYIKKYKPIYNHHSNYGNTFHLERVRKIIREEFNCPKFNVVKLRKIIKKLNIQTNIDEYTKGETITFEDFKKILEELNNGYKIK